MTDRILECGAHRVHVADCLDVMASMPTGSVDCVVTSPPYNLGIAYRTYGDSMPPEGYLGWMGDVAAAVARVLSPGGSLFLNVGSTGSNPWLSMDVASRFRGHLVLQNRITWIKSVSIGDDTFGHFKPISSRRFVNQNHEDLFHFSRKGDAQLDRISAGVPYKDKSNIARRGHAQDRRCAGDTWFVPYDTVRSKEQKFGHPAGFPLGLPLRCLKLLGIPAATVLDPFAGAGTTLVAAHMSGCIGVGVEIDPVYAERAVERLLAAGAGAPA